MKKICRTIKLRKLKSFIDKETLDKLTGSEYIVCFDDDSYKLCLSKTELREWLEKDHIKGISYIFDIMDRIVIDRNVLVNTDEI